MTLRLEVGDVIVELAHDPLAVCSANCIDQTLVPEMAQHWRIRAPDLHASALLKVSGEALGQFSGELDKFCQGLRPDATLTDSGATQSTLQVVSNVGGNTRLIATLRGQSSVSHVRISIGLAPNQIEALAMWASHRGNWHTRVRSGNSAETNE